MASGRTPVSITLPDTKAVRLKAEAEKRVVNQSLIVERALDDWFAKNGDGDPLGADDVPD